MAKTIVKHAGGMLFIGQSASGHPMRMDASETAGGSDSAARPVEMLLGSLGGCTGMDVISVLRKMKTEPRSLSIELHDERAAEYPKAIIKIHLIYKVEGDVPEQNLVKAIELSLTKYCPIVNTLNGVAKITYEYKIEPGQ